MTILETIEQVRVWFKKKWEIPNLIRNIRLVNLLPLLLTNIYNATITTFYVHLATTSFITILPLALTFSISIGLANIIMALIVSYNTLVEKNPDEVKKDTLKKQSLKLKIFLAFAIPAFLLNFAANLIGPYISLPLIGAALSLPTTSLLFIGICIFIGVFTAIAFGLYNIVQIYEVCQRIKPSLYAKNNEVEMEKLDSPDLNEPTEISALSSSEVKPKKTFNRSHSAPELILMQPKVIEKSQNMTYS